MLYLHYHTQIIFFEGHYYAPHYYTAWVNGLLREQDCIKLIAYVKQTRNQHEINSLSEINAKIMVVSLGVKPDNFKDKILSWRKIYNTMSVNVKNTDKLLIRLPTILYYPIIRAFLKKKAKVNIMLVGNIIRARKGLKDGYKGAIINIFWYLENYYLKRLVKRKKIENVLTNGVAPAIDYGLHEVAKNIFTSTIWKTDVVIKAHEPMFQQHLPDMLKPKMVIITRNSEEKLNKNFLNELVDNLDVSLHVIGVEGRSDKNLKYHGYLHKSDFLEIIKSCDIGLVLSDVDWQPRVVWEFLGCGLPVIINRNIRGQYWSFAHKTKAIQVIEKNTVDHIGVAIQTIASSCQSELSEEASKIARAHTVEESSRIISIAISEN